MNLKYPMQSGRHASLVDGGRKAHNTAQWHVTVYTTKPDLPTASSLTSDD